MRRLLALAALALLVGAGGCHLFPEQQAEKEKPAAGGISAPNGEGSPFQ